MLIVIVILLHVCSLSCLGLSQQMKLSIFESSCHLRTCLPRTVKAFHQTRRHGGAHRGCAPQITACAPPKRKLCPPKRGVCPEEINRLGATGVQIEAQIGVFCELTPDFMPFCWMNFFFFLEITCFRPEKPLEFPISAGKSL